ncbi:hypothetical protein Pcinc_005355 [Petrolisthes cinctipes]|uniref:Tubulin-specific chaperone D n=1 Tax=Petrolisthes cinctipes TaxID=88211 RepID=A0AAE1GF35_PETCI|nr:hypothetical protein Pcinc_005355 [Petrolisthes cinctipes]
MDGEVEKEKSEEEIRSVGDDMGLWSCTLDMFQEYQQVQNMLNTIEVDTKNELLAEKAFEDLITILNKYQEQPHLLDPHLELMLDHLVRLARDPTQAKSVTRQTFKYLWLIVKVRGHKIIFKKLPHEVKDLIPVLELLECHDASEDFYQSYVLLLWLSIIIYNPFNMTIFDTTTTTTTTTAGPTVIERIMTVIKTHLNSAQKSREMAAYLAARFLTRPDLCNQHLPSFIDNCFEILDIESQTTNITAIYHKLGVLRSLGLIFKLGRRDELAGHADTVFGRLVASGVTSAPETPIRKLAVKLLQRVGLIFLRPKVAAWRYQRGNRKLAINVESGRAVAAKEGKKKDKEEVEVEEDEEEVVREVEEVIDSLLQSLKDKDTVVRWSAAKGVGRLTARLPRQFGDEVVGAILELFTGRESDKAWHGGCLALAELARRGLLLPERLSEVTPLVERALVYDELRGQCSVGANIRDAACYLCWSMARAYHPQQLAPYVQQLATGLLIVALFDREIPCRRAGSAAFQEHVGRQGAFPHGIEIMTAIDYFAVGKRTNAYLNLSVLVAGYPEYTQVLIDHLVEKKVTHWDSVIRELTAKALYSLTMVCPEYLSEKVLVGLVTGAASGTLATRHGAILSLAHVTHALSTVASRTHTPLHTFINDEMLKKILAIISTLEERQLYRGLGGEYMKQASAVLIEKISLSQLPIDDNNIILKVWQDLLEDCIVSASDNIRTSALDALASFWTTYHQPTTPDKVEWRNKLIHRYINVLHTTDRELYCLGYTAALGCLPKSLACGKFDVLLQALLSTIAIRPNTATWAETRRQAINSTLSLVTTLGINANGKECDTVAKDGLTSIYSVLFKSLDDYTTNCRGDIGAWVREAALVALKTLTLAVLKEDPGLLSKDTVEEMMYRVCQQAVERIDRTRKVAGTTLSALLYSSPPLPHIPCEDKLKAVFPRDTCTTINWASEKTTYTLFVQLLDQSQYRPRLLLGITYSTGGIAANLSRYTSEALHTYLNGRADQPHLLHSFWDTLLHLFAEHQKVDRITLPLIRTLSDLLMSSAVLDTILQDNDKAINQLITLLRKECIKCSDYYKLTAVITILCELLRLTSPTATRNVFTQMAIFLGYQYPKVRAMAATSLLTAIQEYSEERDLVQGGEETLEQINTILEDTEWMNNLNEARTQRNRICQLAGVSPPQPKMK